jgi:His/Glu/Gln/Arg/opine family amino acid ABC transporter permease subunit
MVEKKIVLPEIEELAPEPPPKGPIVWAKDNLFYSVTSTLLTVFGGVVAVLFVRGMFGFILEDERKWEAITTNMRLLMIQAYPQEATWRIWLSLGIIASLFGLSLAFWHAGGKQEPRVLGRAVAAFGGLLIFLFAVAPFEGTVQIVGIAIGLVLVLASLGVMRLLGERAKENTVPVLLIGGILGALAIAVLWVIRVPVPDPEGGIGDTVLEPLATTTTVPWTILFLVTIATYYLGKLLLRVVPERVGRITLIAGWVMSFPIIVLHLARGVEFQNVGQYLLIGLGFAVVGSLIIWYLADPARGELGRGLAGLLLVVAIASWVVSALILIRLLLLLLALFALGGPTFAGGENRTRMRYVGVWLVMVVITVYLMLLATGVSVVQTSNETVFGGFFLTWILATAGIGLSFPMGVVLALGRTSTMPIFRLLSTFYIEVVRGVPLITWLLVSVVVFPILFPIDVSFVAPAKVTLFIAFFSAAYLAENVRGGLQAISKGQTEAANALGMTTLQRTVFITLPQALRAVIPALVGQVIAIFKDTSLVAIVGLFDILKIGREVIPSQTQPFNFLGSLRESLLAVAVIYWIFTFIFSRVSLRLEERLGVGTR